MKSFAASSVFLLLSACTGEPPTAPTPEPVEVEEVVAEVPAKAKEAAELAKALRASPDPAAELSARGMTPAQLDELMFEIASDAELSAAYRAELGQ